MYICVCAVVCVCVCLCALVCACMCMQCSGMCSLSMHVHEHVHGRHPTQMPSICMCISVCARVSVCMYIYICGWGISGGFPIFTFSNVSVSPRDRGAGASNHVGLAFAPYRTLTYGGCSLDLGDDIFVLVPARGPFSKRKSAPPVHITFALKHD